MFVRCSAPRALHLKANSAARSCDCCEGWAPARDVVSEGSCSAPCVPASREDIIFGGVRQDGRRLRDAIAAGVMLINAES